MPTDTTDTDTASIDDIANRESVAVPAQGSNPPFDDESVSTEVSTADTALREPLIWSCDVVLAILAISVAVCSSAALYTAYTKASDDMVNAEKELANRASEPASNIAATTLTPATPSGALPVLNLVRRATPSGADDTRTLISSLSGGPAPEPTDDERTLAELLTTDTSQDEPATNDEAEERSSTSTSEVEEPDNVDGMVSTAPSESDLVDQRVDAAKKARLTEYLELVAAATSASRAITRLPTPIGDKDGDEATLVVPNMVEILESGGEAARVQVCTSLAAAVVTSTSWQVETVRGNVPRLAVLMLQGGTSSEQAAAALLLRSLAMCSESISSVLVNIGAVVELAKLMHLQVRMHQCACTTAYSNAATI